MNGLIEEEMKQMSVELELKSRHEREKESSNKELQIQSIEYQKKLQEELEQAQTENDALLRKSENLAKELIENQEALKEANKLRSQLDDANAKLADSSEHQETARDLLDAAQEAKKASEEELNQLNDKMVLTNQMLYDAQNLASAKDAEIEDLKTKLTSLTDEMEGLKRDIKQSQTDKTMQTVLLHQVEGDA